MTQAHFGSILQPGRMPRPISPTAIVWPLVGDLVNDLGDKPPSYGDFSIRQESPFGDGAIALERPTTNLVAAATGNNADFSKGDLSGWGVSAITGGDGAAAITGDYTPIGSTYARLTSTNVLNDSVFLTSGLFQLLPNTSYVLSLYSRNRLKSNTPLNGQGQVFVLSNTGTQVQLNASNLTRNAGWTRHEFPFTTKGDITGKNQYIRVDADASGTLDVTGLSIEQKEYASSFVNGSRGDGYFDIPIGLLNYWNGTLIFWVKTSYKLPCATVSNPTFLSTGTNSLRMWKWNGDPSHKIVFDWNSDDLTRNNIDVSDAGVGMYNWTMVAMTWSGGSQFIAYLDGEVVSSRSAGTGKMFKMFENSAMRMSGDCMMTDLIIDSKQWTPAEIKGYYQSACRAFSGRDRSTILPVR